MGRDRIPAQFCSRAQLLFNVNLFDRRSKLLIKRIDQLRQAFRTVRARHPFTVDEVVILPGHLHTIWTLPPEDSDYATRWRLIKAEFSRGITANEARSESRRRKDYNLVKHGYVSFAKQWRYSSFERFVARGVYSFDWRSKQSDDGDFGERVEDSE